MFLIGGSVLVGECLMLANIEGYYKFIIFIAMPLGIYSLYLAFRFANTLKIKGL